MREEASIKSPQWVPGGVAANIIGISYQHLICLALKGKISRRLLRISHAQRKPSWHYPIKEVEKLRKRYGSKHVFKDTSGKYVDVFAASKLLDVSTNAIYAYTKIGAIESKICDFHYPTKKHRLGCRLADVLAIRIRQTSTEVLPTYDEEVVLKQKAVHMTVPYQLPLQGSELRNSIERLIKKTKKAKLKTSEFTERLEDLLYGRAA